MKKKQIISDDLKSINKVLDFDSNQDITTSIFLDVRKAKKNGDYPAKIRVTYSSKQYYYDAADISIDQWHILQEYKMENKSPRGNLLDVKKKIYLSFENVKGHVDDLAEGGNFSFDALNTRMSKGKKDSVLDAFKAKIAELKKAGRIGTSVWYSCAYESIKKFTEDEDLKFSMVTVAWLEGYYEQLKKNKRSDTTVSMYMRALRAIINDGMKKKRVISSAQYPFGENKFEIPEGEGRKIALTTSQLMKVFNHPIPVEFEKWRDLFIFSFYCQGANINDILRFKQENIKHTLKGNIIEWTRQKTTKRGKKKPRKIQALITEELQEIMDKYTGNDFLFPYLSDGLTPTREREIIQQVTHNVNREMKKIGKKLGIEKLTTYVARHSFADIARRNDVDVYDISKSLGHATITTTEIYLGNLSVDDLIKNADKMPRKNEYKQKSIVSN